MRKEQKEEPFNERIYEAKVMGIYASGRAKVWVYSPGTEKWGYDCREAWIEISNLPVKNKKTFSCYVTDKTTVFGVTSDWKSKRYPNTLLVKTTT